MGKYKPDGNPIRYGLLSGNEKDYDADYLFSTMQMMSKEDVLEKFRPEEFDFICIDETHRAGAESYQRILEYFKPQFLLGMTAQRLSHCFYRWRIQFESGIPSGIPVEQCGRGEESAVRD